MKIKTEILTTDIDVVRKEVIYVHFYIHESLCGMLFYI